MCVGGGGSVCMYVCIYVCVYVWYESQKSSCYKKIIVQLKFCVPCPCPFRCTNFRGCPMHANACARRIKGGGKNKGGRKEGRV